MYNDKIEAGLICNPKHFWSYALKSDKKGGLPNTMIYDNIVSTIPRFFLIIIIILVIIRLLMLISLWEN